MCTDRLQPASQHQAESTFHKKQGSTSAQLASLNAVIRRLHAARGECDFSDRSGRARGSTDAPHWLGLECSSIASECNRGATPDWRRRLQLRTHPIHSRAVHGRHVWHQAHGSLRARRRLLNQLVSVRKHDQPILVVYEGPPRCPDVVRPMRSTLVPHPGLSAPETSRFRVKTEYVMIPDPRALPQCDQCGTLDRSSTSRTYAALVAACHHPHDCYAHSFVVEGSICISALCVRTSCWHSPVRHAQRLRGTRAVHPWDERQQMPSMRPLSESQGTALSGGLRPGGDGRAPGLQSESRGCSTAPAIR